MMNNMSNDEQLKEPESIMDKIVVSGVPDNPKAIQLCVIESEVDGVGSYAYIINHIEFFDEENENGNNALLDITFCEKSSHLFDNEEIKKEINDHFSHLLSTILNLTDDGKFIFHNLFKCETIGDSDD